MKKKLKEIINTYTKFKNIYNFFFIIILLIITIILNKNFSSDNFNIDNLIQNFYLIFLLFFIIYFWILLITYSTEPSRTLILQLIVNQKKVLNKKKIIGAEVGVYKGSYSSQIVNYFKNRGLEIELYLIDPWKIDQNYKQNDPLNRTEILNTGGEYETDDLDIAYEIVKNKFKNNHNVKIIRLDSYNASMKFENEHFDFIYIDGNHDYNFVKQDLNIWFPKLKDKGILFGDDYSRPYGVQKAVAEFAYSNKLIVHFTDNFNQYYFQKNI